MQTLELPYYEFSNKSRNAAGRSGASGKTLGIFILSCPDYDSNGLEYTFGQLNEGVPLLAKLHLSAIEPLLQLCEAEGIKTSLEVLIADIEAVNPTLVQAYTAGDESLYQKKCDSSVKATEEYMVRASCTFRSVDISASSFLRRFEPSQITSHDPEQNSFLRIRQHYKEHLKGLLETDHSLAHKVHNNVRNKSNSNYYQTEYAGLMSKKEMRLDQELTSMAEYLALGQLIGSLATSDYQPILVTHSTANVHLFNATNKVNQAVSCESSEIPTIPLAVYTRSVIADGPERKMV